MNAQDKQIIDEALRLLEWARICICESEIEWAPPDCEPLKVSNKTFRKRQNRAFIMRLQEFQQTL
jgi:hypothetical protein